MKSTRIRNAPRKEDRSRPPDTVQGGESAPTKKQPPNLQCWTPSSGASLKLLMAARFCAALLSNITDCDETYNYWEPTHFLIYGRGFQTWEYSPVYAIRSYAYVFLHMLPGKLYSWILDSNKILVFYFIRCLLGMICALTEFYFYRGVCKNFGGSVGRLTLAFMILSTGMFISSAAFLPSSFSMYMTMISMGGWYTNNLNVAILATAMSSFISWPFAVAIGLPIAADIVLRRQHVAYFVQWCVIAVIVILIPQVMIDTYMYGKLVIAPLNIVTYNVFSEHGPDIYGVEPWSFYFQNGFLNFNVIFPLALVALPFAMFVNWVSNSTVVGNKKAIPIYLTLSSFYIWCLIFFTRPHKEERFLFPIYPLVCLGGGVSLSACQKLYHWLFTFKIPQHYTYSSNHLAIAFTFLFGTLSLMRSGLLFYAYHAPLDLYPELKTIANNPNIHTLPPDKLVNVCVGKEWYRFPSSFFLPDNWRLQFIESEFRGQLPKPFDESDPDATTMIPSHMNDKNQEEISRYIDISKCHYLVDLDMPVETAREPRYANRTDEWQVVASQRFMDAATSSYKWCRSFYVPLCTRRYTYFRHYNILKTKRRKNAPKQGKKRKQPPTKSKKSSHDDEL
ncbi:alpha-1,2-mannosyltransferase ALG9 isoform X1 [Strongylocentrotus purpuratus]|uniref:Mannosyltransferase n=1 Tax=Strongylocentrotus purpuratus TaxID=7668 RepID=A0A7M7SX99_STRPU|nr:alpha-1,2-mannosyltransferase ALG9 isoform X1 [Strongylocentrotus purpuratus]